MYAVYLHGKRTFLTTGLHQVTPAFYGAGMLSGLNASWSFCESFLSITFCVRWFDNHAIVGGSILAWGISTLSMFDTKLGTHSDRTQFSRTLTREEWPCCRCTFK